MGKRMASSWTKEETANPLVWLWEAVVREWQASSLWPKCSSDQGWWKWTLWLWYSRLFLHDNVENCKLQLGTLRVKTGQTHLLHLNWVQTRNIAKAKDIANHYIWHKAWLVARVWPGSGSRRNQGNSSWKIKMEIGSKKQGAWESL